jgi:hypothetical protein
VTGAPACGAATRCPWPAADAPAPTQRTATPQHCAFASSVGRAAAFGGWRRWWGSSLGPHAPRLGPPKRGLAMWDGREGRGVPAAKPKPSRAPGLGAHLNGGRGGRAGGRPAGLGWPRPSGGRDESAVKLSHCRWRGAPVAAGPPMACARVCALCGRARGRRAAPRAVQGGRRGPGRGQAAPLRARQPATRAGARRFARRRAAAPRARPGCARLFTLRRAAKSTNPRLSRPLRAALSQRRPRTPPAPTRSGARPVRGRGKVWVCPPAGGRGWRGPHGPGARSGCERGQRRRGAPPPGRARGLHAWRRPGPGSRGAAPHTRAWAERTPPPPPAPPPRRRHHHGGRRCARGDHRHAVQAQPGG